MAFTVVTSWDFRGSDSAAIKRTSRIGSYTLTNQGTPSYSTDGVTCNANGQGLTLTLPAELKFTSDYWIMCGLRRIGVVDQNVSNFGYIANDSDSSPFMTLTHFYNADGVRASVRTNDGGTPTGGLEDAAALPTLDTDEVFVLRSLATSSAVFKGNTEASAVTLSARPTYTATSHLAIGCALGYSRNPRTRYHWVLVGTGSITTAEMATIQADPNAYLYAAATTSPKHRRRIVGHRPRAKTAPRLRSAFASILSGNSVTPAALPPDYYTPRSPTVVFPDAVSASVSFPESVSPTVSFTP